MRVHPLALTLGLLSLVIALVPGAKAHLGEDEGFTWDAASGELVQLLSFVAAAGITLAGLAYLRRRRTQGRAPDASWGLVLLGIAWVIAAISVPTAWIDQLAWQLAAAALILGTLGAAWWMVLNRREAFWPALRADRRALAIGAIAGLVFLGLFAFGTHMLFVPTAEEIASAGDTGAYLHTYETFGPLAVWPDVEFGLPGLVVAGFLTLPTAAIALTAAGLFALAIGLLVSNFSRGGLGAIGGAGTAPVATNFCACCTPAFYPVLVALFGSGAAPLVYAMSDPDLALFNVAQVGNVWLLTVAVVLGIRRVTTFCRPASDPGADDKPVVEPGQAPSS